MLLILRQLLRWFSTDLLTYLGKALRWVIANPFILVMALLAGLIAYAYFYNRESERLDASQARLKTSQAHVLRLQADSVRLVSERQSAYRYADSLGRSTSATKDSIRAAVDALPPAARTNLNRGLLSKLGLL